MTLSAPGSPRRLRTSSSHAHSNKTHLDIGQRCSTAVAFTHDPRFRRIWHPKRSRSATTSDARRLLDTTSASSLLGRHSIHPRACGACGFSNVLLILFFFPLSQAAVAQSDEWAAPKGHDTSVVPGNLCFHLFEEISWRVRLEGCGRWRSAGQGGEGGRECI